MQLVHETAELTTDLVPGRCEFAVLRPAEAADRLPLLYLLHGGGGDRGALDQVYRAPLQAALDSGELQPVVAVTPSAGMSYYLDFLDGSEHWETLIVHELRSELRKRYGVDTDRTLIAGVSMGGVGTLRLAFRNPSEFIGAAALEPGVDPFLALTDMPDWYAATKDARLGTKFGEPVDEAFWAANNPANIAAGDPAGLIASGLKIMLEVGTHDGLFNHHNVEFLHRVLFDHGVKHEYRCTLDADHIGPSMPGRIRAALKFLNGALNPSPDPDSGLRRRIETTLRGAGIEPPPF